MNKLSKIFLVIIIFLVIALGLVVHDDICQREMLKDIGDSIIPNAERLMEANQKIDDLETEIENMKKDK